MSQAVLGERIPGERPLALSPAARRRHVYLLGKSGVGKSTLLRNLILEDLRHGEGVALLDPHGDLVEELLEYIPRHRTRDVIYFDPANPERSPGLNVLGDIEEEERYLLISDLVAIFTNLWPEFWGPRTEHIFTHSLAALLAAPNTTLLALPKLLTSPLYRAQILRRVTDPVVLRFFEHEYDAWPERFRQEATAPLLNKLGKLLLSPSLRCLLGQVTSTIHIPTVLERRQIFLANLSKGTLGVDVASLLGSTLVTMFEIAALRRARLNPSERHPYYLYLDEVQSFALQSNFELLLSEARKYALSLTFANQYLEQLPSPVRAAIFGNVGTIVVFSLGVRDAPDLAQELGRDEFNMLVTADELQNLPAYQAYLRTLLENQTTRTSQLSLYPPLDPRGGENTPQRVLNASYERFTRPRSRVEAKLRRFLSA